MATFKQYEASGGASENFSIPTFTSDEIKVRVEGVLKTAATHYNITNYTTNGGTVTWTSGNVPSSGTVRIYRESNLTAQATYQAGSSIKADDLNNNQTQALRALEETDQLVQTYEIDDGAVTTAKMAFNSLDTLAGQITANEPGWLTDIGIVAGDLGLAADMGAVADPSDTVTLGAINTVATNISNVNRYANEYKIAASAPSSPNEGDLWYDTTNNVMKYHNGSAFVAIGGAVTVVDEDNMASNSATVPPSQQSVKAYVDSLAWLDQTNKQTGSVVYYDGSTLKADNTTTKDSLVHGGQF
tara:strand:+ start:169 stop:1068 length:900 start_codon:yes stop_codon:yes gene_type:complete